MGKIVASTDNPHQDIHKERTFDPSRKRYDHALRLLKRHVDQQQSSPTLVDIGGGTGEFTSLARTLGFETTLIDGNQNNVSLEREKGAEAKFADLNDTIDLPADSADAVICLEVIEHIVCCEHLLAEIKRILKPGGVAIISTPNFSFYQDRIKYLLGQNVYCEGYHYRFFTQKSLRKKLNTAGLNIVDSGSIAPVSGINAILSLLNSPKRYFTPVAALEPLLARTLMYACRK